MNFHNIGGSRTYEHVVTSEVVFHVDGIIGDFNWGEDLVEVEGVNDVADTLDAIIWSTSLNLDTRFNH